MIYVLIGATFEVYWAWGLKHLMGSLLDILSVFVALTISLFCIIKACKSFEVSIVYAIFTGLGASGLVIIDMFSLGFSLPKLFLICLLLLGIIGIKIANTQSSKQEEKS